MEHPSGIITYGKFSVLTYNGQDISEEFSPKIFRLFSLLLVNPDGITSQVIDQDVWGNAPVASLKNSRNVAINRLRALLTRAGGFELVCDHRLFALNTLDGGYSEFHREIELRANLNGPPTPQYDATLHEWLGIVKKGKLLPHSELPWVAQARDTRFEDTLRILHALRADEDLAANPENTVRINETILALDGLNEPAIHTLVSTLFRLGRHGAAAQSYDQYARHFKATFGKSYDHPLEDLVAQPPQ